MYEFEIYMSNMVLPPVAGQIDSLQRYEAIARVWKCESMSVLEVFLENIAKISLCLVILLNNLVFSLK